MSRTVEITPLRDVKRAAILSAVNELKGDIPLIAEALGIGARTVYRKLREYGVSVEQDPATGRKRLTSKAGAGARFVRTLKRKR